MEGRERVGVKFMVKVIEIARADREQREGDGGGRKREKQSLLDNATHAYPIPSCNGIRSRYFSFSADHEL